MGSSLSSLFHNSQEEIINCTLTASQKYYCQEIIHNKMNLIIENSINFQNQKDMFNDFQKVYDHPYLIQDSIKKKHDNDKSIYDVFVKSSGKMLALDKSLTRLIQNKHKIVILTRYQKMGKLINDYLKNKNFKSCLLDSTIRGREREEMIDKFQKGEALIFILCVESPTKGINLTSADTIFIYDSNLESQNISSALKCCLTRNNNKVSIFRLISSKTYETVMLGLAKDDYHQDIVLFRQNMDILLRYAFYYAFEDDFTKLKTTSKIFNDIILDPQSFNFWLDFQNKYKIAYENKLNQMTTQSMKRLQNDQQKTQNPKAVQQKSTQELFELNAKNSEDLSDFQKKPLLFNELKQPTAKDIKNSTSYQPKTHNTKAAQQAPITQKSFEQNAKNFKNQSDSQNKSKITYGNELRQPTTQGIKNRPSYQPKTQNPEASTKPKRQDQKNPQKVQPKSQKPKLFVNKQIPQVLRDYLNQNQDSIINIINEKGPLDTAIDDDEVESDKLPTFALNAYDVHGNVIQLTFETDSYFVHPINDQGQDQRIFYNEILEFFFIQIEKYNNRFVIFVFQNLYGTGAYLFLQRKFINAISIYIDKKAALANMYLTHVVTNGLLDATPHYNMLMANDGSNSENSSSSQITTEHDNN